MTPYSCLLFVLLAYVHVRAIWTLDESTDAPCIIRAKLYVTPAEQRSEQDFGLPLDIDCGAAGSASEEKLFDMGAQRVAGKTHVTLDGSLTLALGIASYGLEYLDNCLQLQSLQIEHFMCDVSLALNCEGQSMSKLQRVSLKQNELGTLSGATFQQLPALRHLELEANYLRYIEPLLGCEQLQRLSISHESELVLSTGAVFAPLAQLQLLQLSHLKLIRPAFFEELPGNLRELFVEHTPIVERHVHIYNNTQLVNISIVHCQLLSFGLHQLESTTVLHLNLSGNALRQLEFDFGLSSCKLQTLDLSANRLESLNASWFLPLTQLQVLQLQQNQLHSISLNQLLHIAGHHLHKLNLRDNQLQLLQDTQDTALEQAPQLRILIDRNPWCCQWLLNFTHAQPQMFRLFQYAKYISQINVNGLSCSPEQAPLSAKEQQHSENLPSFALPPPTVSVADELHINATRRNISSYTVVYGSPFELKRSQRNSALIIVFMLPLGIALLFLLLYLYLHCERLFHLSYYMSGMQCFGGKSGTTHRFIDHVDIVRYPTANSNGDLVNGITAGDELELDGYETPLNSASICNCAHRQSSCSRSHHVTYEELPDELPYQVYAEIKEPATVSADDTAGLEPDMPLATAPIYDHLSFKEDV